MPALPARTAVMTIRGLPRRNRRDVERAMVLCVRTVPSLVDDYLDPLTAPWCTRWERDRSVVDKYCVRCRQAITGTDDELATLARVLGGLADIHGFEAELV